ncbi:MAG: hypothetical protein PVF05_12515 [Gemmatimonadales bacterium]|jgi:hypothetical protein
MRSSRIFLLAAVAGVIAATGCADDPTGPIGTTLPDLVGAYGGTWTIRIAVPSANQSAEFTCPGIAGIDRQAEDGSFSGVWTQGTAPNCSVEFGTLAGRVEPDASVTVDEFSSDEDFEASTGGQCTFVSGPDSYTGTADGFLFEISRTAEADCQGTAFVFTWTLRATR